MQNLSSEEEISSIPEDEFEDYDKQEFEAIQFVDPHQIEEEQLDHRMQKNGIRFKIPQRNPIQEKKQEYIEPKQTKVLTESTNFMKNHSKLENQRPSTASSYKPIYTTSIHQHEQEQKKYNYKQKSFNTLPKKSDPVSRFQQMSKVWKKTKFLQSTNGQKEGRKLNLDTRIEQQKQELKESGMFHRYIAKSQLFL